MLPKCARAILLGVLLLLLLACSAAKADQESSSEDSPERGLETAIELSEYDYEDACKPAAEAEWTFRRKPNDPAALRHWRTAALDYAAFKKWERKNMSDLFNETFDEAAALGYKLSVIKEPGDAALEDDDYGKLISFVGESRVLQATTRYADDSSNLTKPEVEFLLSHNGKEEDKLRAWTGWHRHFDAQVENFTRVLQLAQKAALANDKSDVKSYWKMLVGEPSVHDPYAFDSYFRLEQLATLRSKLVGFARKRLVKKYNADIKNDTLSAHLLGSLLGQDWTHMALDVAPYPEIIADMRKRFWEKKLIGEKLYKVASGLGKKFLGQTPNGEFFSNSDFTGQCPGHLINFCELGKMRLSTCSEPSISNYLDAHRNIAKVLMYQMSSKVPILNAANRFSVLEEAVSEFFALLAASPAWLAHVGLIDKDSMESEESKLTSLAITALDVLPRLAYYDAADRWRLEAIEKNETDPKKLLSDWWTSRLTNEYISASEELPTFLSDERIASNKPYLSKVLGIVLAFQMYEFIFKSTDVRQEPFDKKSFNHDFVWMVKNGSENWKTLIEKHVGISQISTDPITNYFTELEYHFDNDEEAELTYDLNDKELEIETLEKRERKIFNTPTTTTTTTTTTTISSSTATTSTARPIVKAKPSKAMAKDLQLRPDNSLFSSDKPPSGNFVDESDLLLEAEETESASKPKPDRSTAVWAVAVVLVVTITVCIVAIFGRRRCVRTPKNRRYV